MKRYQYFCLILISVSFFISCKREKPDETAIKFLTCLQQAKYEEAKQYGTPGTCKFLEIYKQDRQDMVSAQQDSGKIEIVASSIKGDSALVKYKYQNRISEVDLFYSNKKWLVDLKMK